MHCGAAALRHPYRNLKRTLKGHSLAFAQNVIVILSLPTSSALLTGQEYVQCPRCFIDSPEGERAVKKLAITIKIAPPVMAMSATLNAGQCQPRQ